MKKSYRDLYIWQAAVDLAVHVNALTADFPARLQFTLVDQMNRAALSVPSNIAEGKGRLTAKELRHFLAIARGSLFELDAQLEVARRLAIVPPDTYATLDKQIAQIGAGINRLLTRLKS